MEGYKKISVSMVVIALLAMLALPALAAKPRYLPHPAGHFPSQPVPQAERAEPQRAEAEVSQAESFDPVGYAFGIVDGAFEFVGDVFEAVFGSDEPEVTKNVEPHQLQFPRRSLNYTVRYPSGTGRWIQN